MKRVTTILAAACALAVLAASVPAKADWNHDHGWRDRDWHGHYWHGYPGDAPGYYVSPPVIYAPPPDYYAPPAIVFAPPGVSVGIN
jgi:hypothetical protein